jgi:hypothetical protein
MLNYEWRAVVLTNSECRYFKELLNILLDLRNNVLSRKLELVDMLSHFTPISHPLSDENKHVIRS